MDIGIVEKAFNGQLLLESVDRSILELCLFPLWRTLRIIWVTLRVLGASGGTDKYGIWVARDYGYTDTGAGTASVQLQLVFMSDAPQVRVWEVLSTQMKAIIATRLISKKNWDGVSGIFESDCDVTCRVLSRDGGDTLRQFLLHNTALSDG